MSGELPWSNSRLPHLHPCHWMDCGWFPLLQWKWCEWWLRWWWRWEWWQRWLSSLSILTSTLVTGWSAVGHDHDEKNDDGYDEKNDSETNEDEAADEKNANDWIKRWGTECTAEMPHTRVKPPLHFQSEDHHHCYDHHSHHDCHPNHHISSHIIYQQGCPIQEWNIHAISKVMIITFIMIIINIIRDAPYKSETSSPFPKWRWSWSLLVWALGNSS